MLPVHWLLAKHYKGNVIKATLQERGKTKIGAD